MRFQFAPQFTANHGAQIVRDAGAHIMVRGRAPHRDAIALARTRTKLRPGADNDEVNDKGGQHIQPAFQIILNAARQAPHIGHEVNQLREP